MKSVRYGLATALFIVGCAGGPQPKEGPTSLGPDNRAVKVEAEARPLFGQAEKSFGERKYDNAEKEFQKVRQRFPRGRAAMLATYRLGTIYYYRSEYPKASREFETFLSKYGQNDLTFDVVYNLAAAEYQQGEYEKAYQTLARLRPQDVQAQGPRRADVVFQLAAQTSSALGNHSGAISAYSWQLQLPLEESKRSNIEGNIDGHLGRIGTRTELERLITEISEPGTRNKISQRIAMLESPIAQAGSAPGFTPEAGTMIGADLRPDDEIQPGLHSSSSGEATHIGVVLPLTGKSAAYGRKALEGILLAAGVYLRARDVNFRLFIEDTASNPAVAAQAAEQLYHRNRVVAIIGPLAWKESLAVADKAQQLGVMNLSLTGKEGISEKGAYLFQNALTPQVQLDNLLRHCVADKGFRRFGILAPKNNFGEDMATQFWELAERYGARIVAYGTYNPDEKDFQAHIRELTGLDDPRYRRLENSRLAEHIKEAKEKTGREPKSRLQPIVDFDALFIPDSPKAVSQIAASLTYFDVSGVPLLGTTEWNSDQLFKRGGRNVEGAIFPGGVSLNSRNARQREFIRLFADSYGSQPDLLSSQAFEAMEIVAAGVRASRSGDRNALVREVIALKNFPSPMGDITFDATRIAKRMLPVFQLAPGGAIVEQTN